MAAGRGGASARAVDRRFAVANECVGYLTSLLSPALTLCPLRRMGGTCSCCCLVSAFRPAPESRPLPDAGRFLSERLPDTTPSPFRALSGRQAQGHRRRHLGSCGRCRLSRPPLAMSEELSADTSYTEDDFYCPVCQEVLKTPVRTAACQHV